MKDSERTFRRDTGMRRSAAAGPAVPAATGPEVKAAGVAREPAVHGSRRLRWLVAMLVVSGLIYAAQLRRPIGPSAGRLDVRHPVVAPAPPRDENTKKRARVRVGTYNIHGGRGTDGRRDLGRIAEMLRGVDFAGLNEVHGPAPWEREDQAASLGGALGMTPLFAPCEERWGCLRFGNGLLTRLEVEHWQVVPLERRYGRSYRNLVHTRARAPDGTPLNLVVAHIDRSDDRERHEQLRTAANFFMSLAPPAVLLGDLNSDAADDEIQRLLDRPGVVDVLGVKYGLQAPRHIDWILVRGLEVADAGITGAGPSDHPHVWADLELPRPVAARAGSERPASAPPVSVSSAAVSSAAEAIEPAGAAR